MKPITKRPIGIISNREMCEFFFAYCIKTYGRKNMFRFWLVVVTTILTFSALEINWWFCRVVVQLLFAYCLAKEIFSLFFTEQLFVNTWDIIPSDSDTDYERSPYRRRRYNHRKTALSRGSLSNFPAWYRRILLIWVERWHYFHNEKD